MSKPVFKVRKPYERSRSSVSFSKPTRTKQAFKAECDINTIMSKYQNTGIIEHVQRVRGSYGDFTSVQEYQLSLQQVIDAQEAFEALPSRIRSRFDNDPSHLLAFLEDPANAEEAVKLGLVNPPTPPSPKPPEAASGAPSGGDPLSTPQA